MDSGSRRRTTQAQKIPDQKTPDQLIDKPGAYISPELQNQPSQPPYHPCDTTGYHPGRFTICEVSEEGLVVEHSASTNAKSTKYNQLINTKYWSVENRNKSTRGRFKIFNGAEFIYIAI